MKRKLFDIFNIVVMWIMGFLIIAVSLAMVIDLGWPIVEEIRHEGWMTAFGALIAGAFVGIIGFVFFTISGWISKKAFKRR